MQFDKNINNTENNFIRNSSSMLNNIFGTEEVTPFWVADMNFTIAPSITAEMQRLVDRSQFAYEFNAKAIFNAISQWYQKRHQLTLNPDNFVQVTGVLTGIGLLIRELTNKGDTVLIQTPAYHQFSKVITTADRQVIKSPLKINNGKYEMDFDDLENKLANPRVKLMILCNPHNPVGRVWTKPELQRLVDIAERHDVTIISDEIHADIIYSGHSFNSLMSLAPEKHVALIGSPSKTFGMQSISNGYIYTANEGIQKDIRALAESLYIDHGNAFTTFSTIAAYEKGADWLDSLLIYLEKNVDWINAFVAKELPNVSLFPVEGTYQVWLDFSQTGLEGSALTKLFGKAGFGAAPGSWFDSEGSQFARMNIAAPLADIKNAFKQLKEVLEQPSEANQSSECGNSTGCC